jgi:hypothetical protein
MLFFICTQCGKIDTVFNNPNWHLDKRCTECLTGVWHNKFPKVVATFSKVLIYGKKRFVEFGENHYG